MSLNYILNENMTNIVKYIIFIFYVVSLYEYSLTHSRYYRCLSVAIARILLSYLYCPINWLHSPIKYYSEI